MRFEVDRHEVVYETIDDEVILIHMKTAVYYSLERGSEIWDAVVAGCAQDQIVELLRRRHDAPRGAIEKGVSSLIEELRAEGLIFELREDQPVNGGIPRLPADGDPATRVQFELPVLHRYTDMADFVLVDPIHEVEDTGWPNRKVAQ